MNSSSEPGSDGSKSEKQDNMDSSSKSGTEDSKSGKLQQDNMDSSSKSGTEDSKSGKGSVNLKYYLVLGVPATASIQEVKKAFREAAMKHHPDKGGNTAEFLDLYRAYKVLSDPVERYKYDHPTTESLCLNFAGVSADVVPVVPQYVPPIQTAPPGTGILPDYVFKPTEEKLIQYLKMKMNHQLFPYHVLIFDVDILSYAPEDLLLKRYPYFSNGRDTWYFICKRSKKKQSDKPGVQKVDDSEDHVDRAVKTGEGRWRKYDNRMVSSSAGIIGERAVLYYVKKNTNEKTRFKMVEYTVRTKPPVFQTVSLCKMKIQPVIVKLPAASLPLNEVPAKRPLELGK